MPYKTGKMKGLLTLAELKKLVVNHNKLSKISMPKGVKRDELIKIINKNGFRVDHTNNKLVKGGGVLKKPVQPAKKKVGFGEGKTKEIKETKKELKSRAKNVETIDANKKKNKQIRDLVSQTKSDFDNDDLDYVKDYNKLKNKKPLTAADKNKLKSLFVDIKENFVDIEDGIIKDEMMDYPPLKKVLDGIKKLVATKTEVKKPPPPRRKLKGRLTAAQNKITDQLEKDIPEFEAENINDRNNRMKLYVPILKVYRSIKQSGTPEQKKQARKVFDEAVGYRGTDASKFNGFKQQLESIMKPEKEEQKEDKKELTNQDKMDKEIATKTIEIIKEFRKEETPELLKDVVDDDGKLINKKIKGKRIPKYFKLRNKYADKYWAMVKSLYKKYNFSLPKKQGSLELFISLLDNKRIKLLKSRGFTDEQIESAKSTKYNY